MATVSCTGKWIARGSHKTTWADLANGDSGSVLSGVTLTDKTVTVQGTFGAGGTVVIEGSSDDGNTWATLNDSRGEGNALSFTAANTVTILENPPLIRPRVTAGDGTTSITIHITSTGAR